MKRLLKFLVPLLAALAAACGSQTADLKDFTQTLYAPSHASRLRDRRRRRAAEHPAESLQPWQGAENAETMLFIARNGETPPAGFTGQSVEARGETHRLHVFDLRRNARRLGTGRPRGRGFRPGLHHQRLCHGTPRRGSRRGLRRQCGLRTAAREQAPTSCCCSA